MNKKALMAIILALAILFSMVAGFQAAIAQPYQTIAITPDGSIQPHTALLERNASTYTFRGNIYGSIVVQKSNITVDGAGCTLQGRQIVDERGLYLVGPDGSHANCGNILVKNLTIRNYYEGIYVVGSSNNSIIGNTFENAGIHLIAGGGSIGDSIMFNTFNNSGIFVDYNPSGLDVVTENNFFDSHIFVDLSKAPIVDRNYWSNYASKYPNAKEANNSEIWDTPYVDDENSGKAVATDYQPLVDPVAGFELDDAAIPSSTPTPSGALTPTPTAAPSPSIPEFPSWVTLPVIVATIGVCCFALRERRKERFGDEQFRLSQAKSSYLFSCQSR